MKNKKLAAKILSIAFAVTALLSGCADLTPSQYITLNEYNAIQMDMTYREVCYIIGGYGTVTHSSRIGDTYYHSVEWHGNGESYSSATIMFVNARVYSKWQYGLL